MNMNFLILAPTLLCISVTVAPQMTDLANRSLSPLMNAVEQLDTENACRLVTENALRALHLEMVSESNLRLTSPLDRAQRLLHNAIADRDSWLYSEHKVGAHPFSDHEVEKRKKLARLIFIMEHGLETLKEELHEQSKSERISYTSDTVRYHHSEHVRYVKGSHPTNAQFIPISSKQHNHR